MEEINIWLEVTGRVLWRCFFIGALFLFFWAGMYIYAGRAVYAQCGMFGLTAHECSVLHYGGMGLFKFLILTMFFIPFISLRIVLRKRRQQK